MATRKSRTRGLGTAAAAGLGLLTGALAALAAERRTVNAVQARLDRLEAQVAHSHRHANLANQQNLHWELLSKAIDSPELAEVLDIFEAPASPLERRQYLFANALYTNLLFYYRIGNLSREEFFGRVRGLLQNPVVREYWFATRGQRATLPEDSDEAELGRMVDDLLRQLEEADTEEWWVVGEPPTE
ncbi:DUF6082 family protein [Streptomyces chromofuscus]|uniref:Secreted protein n=1 Tax=Streptomyces chromofuscus TaxID=42881 RepID=A0A7M2T6E4_STRCW|nr:DUF6082 family protein [Streptomyces chromofuscus]QOV43473.1 hypothetical protein IPT68_27660 [Streptomyces chromofuscus]GGT09833.1 hypothetical protein GCM10010254_32900 [Streptomyces chromofuscus]